MDTEQLYVRAVFGGETSAIAQAEDELDAAEANLALARGRILHAKFLLERTEDPRELALFTQAATLFRAVGDSRGEGEALFWVGTVHQVIRRDNVTALPLFDRSYQLASAAGDKLTVSYALRHLGFVDAAEGRPDVARERFEESVRLRREVGFLPGVAAGLLTLAQHTDRDRARELLDEATSVAKECDANGVLAWIEQTRAGLGD
jgi:tetratricopeptide (TPR) repeat protein